MIFCLFISAHYAYIYIYIFGLTLGSYNVTVIVAHGISIITSAAHLSFPFLFPSESYNCILFDPLSFS